MKEKLFLTSAIAMGFVAPAFAEPSYTGEFPDDGYMQEDYTYTNAATADNMDSVYEGSVNAVAEYDIVDYILSAGQYLPADSETPTTCPAGSYCSGIGEVQYNETSAQGIETCPTGFGSSAAGASSANECYRQCSGNVEIEHATGVTGNDYYGSGVDTCEPTGCVNGWHLKSGVNGTAIATAIGNEAGINSAIIRADGTFSELDVNFSAGNKGQAYYGLTDNNTWAVEYGSNKGMISGQARCSTQAGSNGWYTDGQYDNNGDWSNTTKVSNLTDETGQEGARYCYCNVTGYTPEGGTLQSLSSSWVFNYDASNCAIRCAYFCAFYMRLSDSSSLAFRAALLGSVGASPAMCEANTITINWFDAAQTDIDANNAGVATYGEDVRTPVKANTYKGKTFKGWRFSKPEQTNLSE